MTLIERLIYRRLQSADAGNDAGGAGGGDPVPVQADAATGTEAGVEGVKPAGEEKHTGDTPNPDKPADGEKTPEQLAEEQKLADKAKAESVPEKYEFKSPVEGQELDADMAAALDPVARELGLNNEQAQKLVDIYGKDILPKLEARQAENWAKQTEAWANEVKTDKEIGGDGFVSNVGLAQKALDQFAPAGLRDYLESTGLGNHPDLVRFCVKVGKAMSEDTIVMSNTGGQRSQADILYGNK
ncbi:peptidase [Rouxiella badensis]|uniref:peptidase n=1 Tax=Rouxiella badensis TaxID=1646377 RepID=UPI001D157A13|nr:peptidase [Rouxiella badensis]MCC3733703.1 peptidase [Rouxiella badensis]MCC3759644.1 peptidase [Rouxiella badensis]